MSKMIRQLIKDQVKNLLLETKLSHSEIGKLFNVSRGPIFMIQKELGIKRPNVRIKNNRICNWCKKNFVATGLSRPNRGKYCSKECYRQWQFTDANKGSNHPNWKETSYREDPKHSIRHQTKWKEWRLAVYSRDEYKCKFCNSNKSLEPHHIFPRRDFPDRIFDIMNGITLCKKCHVKTFGKEYSFIKQCEALLMHTSY